MNSSLALQIGALNYMYSLTKINNRKKRKKMKKSEKKNTNVEEHGFRK